MKEVKKLFVDDNINKISVGDKTLMEFITEDDENEKHIKGYMYDSLVYRYIRAREAMAEHEFEIAKRDGSSNTQAYYYRQANRDMMRFCQILNEAIGGHD